MSEGLNPAPAAKVTVPNVVSKSLTAAEADLTGKGLAYDTPDKGSKGNSSTVKKQSPVAGTSVDSGSTVHLYINASR